MKIRFCFVPWSFSLGDNRSRLRFYLLRRSTIQFQCLEQELQLTVDCQVDLLTCSWGGGIQPIDQCAQENQRSCSASNAVGSNCKFLAVDRRTHSRSSSFMFACPGHMMSSTPLSCQLCPCCVELDINTKKTRTFNLRLVDLNTGIFQLELPGRRLLSSTDCPCSLLSPLTLLMALFWTTLKLKELPVVEMLIDQKVWLIQFPRVTNPVRPNRCACDAHQISG